MKLAVLFLCGTMISNVYSLICYTCDNTVKYPSFVAIDRCASKRNFTSLMSMECPELTPSEISQGVISACYKLERTTLEFGPDAEAYIYQRGCTKTQGEKQFCYDQFRENPENLCFLCTTNLCNNASDMQILRILLFFVAIIIVLYMQDQRERNHLRDNSALLCFTCYNHPKRFCNAEPGPLGPRPQLATTNCPQTPEHEYNIGGRQYCYKTEKDVQTDYNMTYQYDRGCTVVGGYKDFCAEQFQRDPEVRCYLCQTDWCNLGAPVYNFKVFRLLVAAFIFMNIMYLNNFIGFINIW